MSEATRETVFPTRSTAETKADNTTRAAKEIIDSEATARQAKTARLRQARLSKKADEPDAPSKPKPKQPARKAKGRKA